MKQIAALWGLLSCVAARFLPYAIARRYRLHSRRWHTAARAAAAMDSIGHIVDGRYVITYRIHIGRMATVYLARDQFLHRSVVLKVLHPSLAAVPAYVERFRREACIAAALSHPNLISVYNLGA